MSEPVSREIPLTLVDRKPADGTDGDDIIVGTGGAETLIGSGGDDFVFGGEGDDLIIGGQGNDTLIGGQGNDTFKWSEGDQGTVDNPAIDTILDFGLNVDDSNGNDRLHLTDLLQGEYYSRDAEGNFIDGNLEEYLFFGQEGSDTVISVNSQGGSATDGSFDHSKVDQKIILKDVNMADLATETGASQSDIINNLIAQGKLIVDQSS